MIKTSLSYLLLTVCLLTNNGLRAQWTADPKVNTPIATTAGKERFPAVFPGQDGCSFIKYYDYSYQGTKIVSLDHDGRVSANSIQIPSSNCYVVKDFENGLYVVWNQDAKIYAHRYKANLEKKWNAQETVVDQIAWNAEFGALADGAGGLLVYWTEPGALNGSLKVQKLSASQSVMWSTSGETVTSSVTLVNDVFNECAVANDGAGGVIFAWAQNEKKSGDYQYSSDIYAQRIKNDKSLLWTSPKKITTCKYKDKGSWKVSICPGKFTDFFIAWAHFFETNGAKISGQYVNAGGSQRNFLVCDQTDDQKEPQMVSDAKGGAIVVWKDERNPNNSDNELYCQHVDSNGTALWSPSSGVAAITGNSGNRHLVSICQDGNSGVLISCRNTMLDNNGDIYVQKVDQSGLANWGGASGLAAASATGMQYTNSITSDGFGGAIVVWEDTLNASTFWNVKAQHIKSNGTLGSFTSAAKPTFSPIEGSYSPSVQVSISCATAGASIYFTLNGADPTEASSRYTGPIPLSGSTTIKAKAFASGMVSSPIASAAYTILPQVATPTFAPAAGNYATTQSVVLSCSTAGASIYYTTNGTEPSESSTRYTIPISVAGNMTIKAKAYAAGMTPSNTASAAYTIQVATPTFSPAAGNYATTQSVVLSCSTAGASIYYTTNGTEPNESSTRYTIPISVAGNMTIKAKAYAAGMTPSNTASAAYTIQVATPTFSPGGGDYAATQTVTISCTTAGALIYYTTNSTEPNESSMRYTAPITVASSTTIKAKAYATGMTPSNMASATYTIIGTVAMPTFNPGGGDYAAAQTVTISCATAGASIYYTTDNIEPSESSMRYTAPITVASSTTIKAKAYASGMTPSNTASAVYTITLQVATPTFSPGGGDYAATQTVTISCATAGASIYYTTDNIEPSESSMRYTAPITVASSTTIRAKAYATGMTPSNTNSATYTIIGTVAMPTFNPVGGNYTATQTVTISCATAGASIFYTTDSTEPSESSTRYTIPISVSSTMTIKAKAYSTGMTPSSVASVTYNIILTVATPIISPSTGNYSTPQIVSITCATSAAVIYYTVDNSEPTEGSTRYTSPFTIYSTTTITAKAFSAGMTASATASVILTIATDGDREYPKINVIPSSETPANMETAISAEITDDKGINQAFLFYRRGGLSSYSSIAMNRGTGNLYSGKIPAVDVAENGLEYYILATDQSGKSTKSPDPASADTLHILQVRVSSLQKADPTPAKSYRMISVPLQLSDYSVESVLVDDLGSYDKTKWRIFRVINGVNVEYGELGFPSMNPGYGFWLITKEAKNLDVGSGLSISTAQAYSVSLSPGWNQLGNPFAFAVSWGDIEKNAGIENQLLIYSGSGYQQVSYLSPWQGALVKNNASTNVVIKIKPKAAVVGMAKENVDGTDLLHFGEGEWALQIIAECGEYNDQINYIGCVRTGSLDWDSNDLSEPPVFFDFVSLYFSHETWAQQSGRYTADFHPLEERAQSWNFDVATNISAPVSLSLGQKYNVPADWLVRLIDHWTGAAVDFSERSPYAFNAGTPRSNPRFSIFVSREPVVKDLKNSQAMPFGFQLEQNFPNPFNPGTEICYQLTDEGMTRLEIYDLQGRLVRALVHATQAPGRHHVYWDGTIMNGDRACSGVYLMRLQWRDQFTWRKITVMK